MLDAALATNDTLVTAGRIPALARAGERISALELASLMLIGAGAALATLLIDMKLRIPGHAILRAVFPMAFGIALVPRRLGGSIMGGSALATAAVLQLGGLTAKGSGAVTSLCLTGVLLDVALWSARGGWRLYLGFVLAGLGSNLAAFAVQLGLKLAAGSASRGLAEWLPRAVWTYPLCGVIAGLVSAAAWFHFAASRRASERTERMP